MTDSDAQLSAPLQEGFEHVLTADALTFLATLHRVFNPVRLELLAERARRRARMRDGELLDFSPATADIRTRDWQVAPAPADLRRRWVEITGPPDRKLVINAMNSGADGFMADFEDASAPTWANLVQGQINLRDAIDRTIAHDGSDGRHYQLGPDPATLHVRPRGWHLVERHLRIDGEPCSGSLFDFGLYAFHCAARLLAAGSGPYFYLPKLESRFEARLWNDVFAHAEDALGLPRAAIRATVLIETLPAAFEMDEILYELRDRSAGLNAGRWDYIFSAIKSFPDRPEMVLPDRGAVTMTVPFMRAYTELLAATCHRRGAHAIGGMAALIPSRRDPVANTVALEAVRADKQREVGQGYDGTWVAHPDLVPTARAVFEAGLGGADNQLRRRREDVRVTAAQLLDLAATPGQVTERGLRTNLRVGFQYLSFWLSGRGAAAIEGLMEDAATAEISRAQIWQWVRHRRALPDGRTITPELVLALLDEETAAVRAAVGEATWGAGRPQETRALFEEIALSEELQEFVTIAAYELLDHEGAAV
jgi:malate synthase